MADPERPSPYTIPAANYIFAKSSNPSEPRDENYPPRPMTVGNLIHNLIEFANAYESNSAEILRAEGIDKIRAYVSRDAIANSMQQEFKSGIALDRVRTYVLANYGAELTIGTARRLLGELIRICSLTVDKAEALLLEDAIDRLAHPAVVVPDSAPPCPGCGSAPAAMDVNDICPTCGAYNFLCGIVEHVSLGNFPIIKQQLQQPRWVRIPPSQVRAKGMETPAPLTGLLNTPKSGDIAGNQCEATPTVVPVKPADKPQSVDKAFLSLAKIYTNGASDERMKEAARIVADGNLTANQKLYKIDKLISFPATASRQDLGDMLNVSKSAIQKTAWYKANKEGEKESEVGRRREGHQIRAKLREPKDSTDDGE